MVCFSSLEVLEAKDNKIDDLFELEMCTTLKKINLKNNLIKEEDNIFFLTSLIQLKYLNLNGNIIQSNENYKNLILENLMFVEKIDIDEIESPKFTMKKINNSNNNELYTSKDSNEINFDSTNTSLENRSNNINSIRPPSSNTSNNFYKKEINTILGFSNRNNNILDNNTNIMPRTGLNWKNPNSSNLASLMNKNLDRANNGDDGESRDLRLLQGIKSILRHNKKTLNEDSFIANSNDHDKLNNTENNSLNIINNIKGISETARGFPTKHPAIPALSRPKGLINILNNINNNQNDQEEKIEIKKPIIKKPVIIKSIINTATNNTGETLNKKNNLIINNNNNIPKTGTINFSSTAGNFFRPKEGAQMPLKPVIIKKINNNQNEFNTSNHNSNLDKNLNNTLEDAINTSLISNPDNKIIFKNKPIIIKNPAINPGQNYASGESNSPKKLILNPTLLKVIYI